MYTILTLAHSHTQRQEYLEMSSSEASKRVSDGVLNDKFNDAMNIYSFAAIVSFFFVVI